MKIRPLLLSFDPRSMSVMFSCWDDAGIERVRVFDRFDIVVQDARPKSTEKTTYLEVKTDEISRRRFPLFVEGKNSAGDDVARTELGPVYAAPTDEEHTGGVGIPPGAVDAINDPKIRELKADAHRAAGRHTALRQHVQALRTLAADHADEVQHAATLTAVFSAALVVLSGLPTTPRWEVLAVGGLLVLVPLGRAVLAWRRRRVVSGEMKAVAAKATESRVEWEAVAKTLRGYGVAASGLSYSSSPCTCDGKSLE